MARPIKYDKDEVLEKATELFWRQGYENTSLEDILKATGFNRHSLYCEFGSKEGLFVEALRNYKRQSEARLAPAADVTGLDVIRAVFQARKPFDCRGIGCLFTSTMNERHVVPVEAFEMARQTYREIEDTIYDAIREAQKSGDVPAEKDPKGLAKYVVVVLQGLGTMSKAGITTREVERIAEQTIQFVTA